MAHDRPGLRLAADLAAAYALGALSADEARRFEAFLATSPEAQREVAEYREVAALLALGGRKPRPDAALRERVMARIGEGKVRALPPRRRAGRPAAACGSRSRPACSLAVGLGAGLVSARGRLAAIETELAARDQTLAQTRQQLTEREATLNSILEPGVQLFQLTASGDPEPGIQLFWNRAQDRAIVHGYRLKAVPPGQAYQLWFIKDGKPVPSVTFKPEPDGHARVEQIPVPSDGTVSAAAITVEPKPARLSQPRPS